MFATYVDGVVFVYKDIWKNFGSSFDENTRGIKDISSGAEALFHNKLPKELLKNNVVVERSPETNNYDLVEYSVSGKKTYDLVFEIIDGEKKINLYETGTYVAPPTTTITLQPINR